MDFFEKCNGLILMIKNNLKNKKIVFLIILYIFYIIYFEIIVFCYLYFIQIKI